MLWCNNRFLIQDSYEFVCCTYWDDKSKSWKLVATANKFCSYKI